MTGAIAGGLAVALGAFGAHALKAMLVASHSLEMYEVAARYQFYHALALLLIGLLMDRAQNKKALGRAAFFMVNGILFFSGSLYILALTSFRAVGFLTPVGGLFFLVGWGLLFWSILKTTTTFPAPSHGTKKE